MPVYRAARAGEVEGREEDFVRGGEGFCEGRGVLCVLNFAYNAVCFDMLDDTVNAREQPVTAATRVFSLSLYLYLSLAPSLSLSLSALYTSAAATSRVAAQRLQLISPYFNCGNMFRFLWHICICACPLIKPSLPLLPPAPSLSRPCQTIIVA